MGFFSWKCAVSGESIANRHSGQPKEQTQCILVTPKHTFQEDSYEGYGVFGDVFIYDLLGEGDENLGIFRYYENPDEMPFKVKVVLKKHYTGQTYDELAESETCEAQGYFYD